MSNNPTDKMIAQFKSLEDLQAFSKAQQKTLIDITKKLKASEDEVKHLKKLLDGAVPVINAPAKMNFATNDEESIAREQLYLLKQISSERQLDFEETKKVEIYTKILLSINNKPKAIEVTTRNLSNEQLIAALNPSEKDDDRSDDQH